LTVEADV